MAGRRLGAAFFAFVFILGVTGFLPGSSPTAEGAASRLVLDGHRRLASGVHHYRYVTATPRNVVHVLQVKAGSAVTIDAVLSRNRILGDSTSSGLETTSSMCRRAGALACVNGDFTTCHGCTSPLGGVVRHGEMLRSPNPSWPQLSIGPGGIDAGPMGWVGRMTAIYKWKEQPQEDPTGVVVPGLPPTQDRTKWVSQTLTGVNVARGTDALVLYTPSYAATTRTQPGGYEVVVTADSRPALGRIVHLGLVKSSTIGNLAIPSNGYVLSASGPAADRLRAFVHETKEQRDRLWSVDLRVQTPVPVTHSLGGHPVILRDSAPLPPPHPEDTASRVRHPRTIVGWNPAGDVWLVTIDGRQPGRSVGATYWEAASVLLQLGATDAINLDGGGSTTFVANECASRSICVRNRPSDGRERAVTTALAVVPRR